MTRRISETLRSHLQTSLLLPQLLNDKPYRTRAKTKKAEMEFIPNVSKEWKEKKRKKQKEFIVSQQLDRTTQGTLFLQQGVAHSEPVEDGQWP